MRLPSLGTLVSVPILALTGATPHGAAGQSAPPPDFQPAVQAFAQQDFDRAAELLEGVTASAPEFANGWIFLGRAHLGAGRTGEARAAFDRARALPGSEGQADYFDGLALAEMGDVDAAFGALRRAEASGTVNVTNVGLAPQDSILRHDPRYREIFPSPEEYAAPFAEEAEILFDWTGEAPGDQFGWIARNVGDVDGDGLADVTISAPYRDGNRGRAYVYSTGSGEALWTADGEPGDLLGTAIDEAGDVDGDGTPDVVAGAPGGGRAVVWSGDDGDPLLTLTDSTGISFGGGVSGVGDVDGDGHGDILVGAGGANGGAGRARVYSGADGSVVWQKDGAPGERLGSTVGGWVHGDDGLLVVGAPGGGSNGGGVTYVFRGLSDEPAFVVTAEDTGAQNGAMFVSVLGDVDGDAMPDVYSADWADGGQTGRIYVHSGATGERLYTMGGEAPGDGFGIGVADAGDVDGDGLADLVVGAWQHGSAAVSGGKVYVYDGATAELLYAITGDVPGETFGFDATGIGDVNGDGLTDLLLTSAWSGINGTRSGRTLIVAGRPVR